MTALAISPSDQLASRKFGGVSNDLDAFVKWLLDTLPTMSESSLQQTLTFATQMQDLGFLLRGAIGSEYRRRATPLAGGRGAKDTEGVGVTALMKSLAEQVGVSRQTLQEDVRLVETFFDTPLDLAETLREDPQSLLPRGIYQAIMENAPGQEREAAEYAVKQRNLNTHYSSRDAAADCLALFGNGLAPTDAEIQAHETRCRLHVEVSSAAQQAIVSLSRKWGTSWAATVDRVLIEFAQHEDA